MRAKHGLRIMLLVVMLCGWAQAQATNVTFVGQIGYEVSGPNVILSASEVRNLDDVSANLRMELWAYPQPFNGSPQAGGVRTAVLDLGQLAGGSSITNIQASVPFSRPPTGTWYFTMFLTEFTGAPNNDGYVARAYGTFPTPVTFGPGNVSFTPTTGLWWNPNESGSGYNIQVRHGVLVLIMYSYEADGDPIWYLLSGPLTDNGTKLVATLDKYKNGQCAGCVYNGRPVADGNDGPITVQFTSENTATLTFGNTGRVVQIEPYNF